ncbi:MAG TPA: PAS domain S-box protein [Candidatus Cloacimonadota bacterium]|nr:PAS domain S-box protein [Candidatus Cloacimonadota bacterium]HPT70741.1 PAS domain S-box protein [Candidatus Cloacimonadota bacterium]
MPSTYPNLREILDIVNDSIFIHDPITGNIIDVNKKACDTYQYSYDEMLKLTTQDISSSVHPYTQEEALKLMYKTSEGEPQIFEWQAKKKNGDLFWVEVNVQLAMLGNKTYLVVLERDITDRKLFVKALEESQRQVTTLMSNLPGMAYRCKNDNNWTMEFVSKGCFQLTGYTPADLIYNSKISFNDLIIPEDRQYVWNEVQDSLLRKQPYQLSYRIRSKDGDIRWVWEKGSLISPENDELEGFIMDISDLKATEQELMESKSQFEALVDAAPVGVVIYNDDGDIEYLNKEHTDIFGYVLEENSSLETWFNCVFPDEKYRSYLRREWDKRYKESVETNSDFQPLEAYATNKDKQVRVVEIRIAHMGKQHIAICTDLTLRREAETALMQKTEELDSFFKLAIDLMCIADINGRFHRLNPAWEKTFGYSLAELLNTNFLDLVHPDDLQLTLDALSILKGQNELFKFENRYRCKDGSYRWIEWHAVPFGSLLYAAARDITERKRIDEEIRELNAELETRVLNRTSDLAALNKEMESFAYSVSHDLRAPLRSISGFSHALDEDYKAVLDDTGKDYLRRIMESSARMSDLIDALLSLSRVARNEMKLIDLNLSEYAEAIADDLKKANPFRNTEFLIEKNLKATGDSVMMSLVLQNLMGNAWKFTGKIDKATIEVGKTTLNGKKVFFVRDNGAGFDMKYADKLFQPFQRLHGQDEFPGSGVGLATVMRIISRHQGTIWVESTEGIGTTFFFTVNVKKD